MLEFSRVHSSFKQLLGQEITIDLCTLLLQITFPEFNVPWLQAKFLKEFRIFKIPSIFDNRVLSLSVNPLTRPNPGQGARLCTRFLNFYQSCQSFFCFVCFTWTTDVVAYITMYCVYVYASLMVQHQGSFKTTCIIRLIFWRRRLFL